MTIAMSDCPNRKACDRCHAQKLSCKRYGDEACERCLRLRTECKSSPSLRYRKQHTAVESLVLEETTGPSGSSTALLLEGGRSPKRKRTESENLPVPPDFASVGLPMSGEFESHPSGGTVTHDQMMNIADYAFGGGGGFDPAAALYPSHTVVVDHHPSQLHPGLSQHLISRDNITDTWLPQHLHASTLVSHTPPPLPSVPPRAPTETEGGPLAFTSTTAASATSKKQHHNQQQQATLNQRQSSDRPSPRVSKPRGKFKTRQIVLKSSTAGKATSSSAGHWMPRLSDINSRLFELSSALPYQIECADGKSHHGKSSQHHGNGSGRHRTVPFPVDEMFKLSQQFAEAVQDITPSDGPAKAPDTKTSRGKSLNSKADPGSSMFILSTYVRLLDMYQKVFSCIHGNLSQLEAGDGLRYWKLPDVTVGSFAVDSTPSLQMSLTIQLAEEFLSQLRNAAASLGPGGSSGGRSSDGSMFSGVVDVSFQAIKSREDSLGKQLADLRRDMDAILDG
ncbi:hypothetical protein VD0002_g5671 [Verticillium dahliae]|nr:hypothetical protein VD0002_g5671 [Verticillium dahliae]